MSSDARHLSLIRYFDHRLDFDAQGSYMFRMLECEPGIIIADFLISLNSPHEIRTIIAKVFLPEDVLLLLESMKDISLPVCFEDSTERVFCSLENISANNYPSKMVISAWLKHMNRATVLYSKYSHTIDHSLNSSDLSIVEIAAQTIGFEGFWTSLDQGDTERISAFMWKRVKKNKAFRYSYVARKLNITLAEARRKNVLNATEIGKLFELPRSSICRLFSGSATPVERNQLFRTAHHLHGNSLGLIRDLGESQAGTVLNAAGVGTLGEEDIDVNLHSVSYLLDELRLSYEKNHPLKATEDDYEKS